MSCRRLSTLQAADTASTAGQPEAQLPQATQQTTAQLATPVSLVPDAASMLAQLPLPPNSVAAQPRISQVQFENVCSCCLCWVQANPTATNSCSSCSCYASARCCLLYMLVMTLPCAITAGWKADKHAMNIFACSLDCSRRLQWPVVAVKVHLQSNKWFTCVCGCRMLQSRPLEAGLRHLQYLLQQTQWQHQA